MGGAGLVLDLYVCSCTMPVPGTLIGQNDGIISPGTRVAGDYELANGYWESKLGPLQERPMLLTTELSFYLGSKNMLTGGTF